jgi:hypothetical protein
MRDHRNALLTPDFAAGAFADLHGKALAPGGAIQGRLMDLEERLY